MASGVSVYFAAGGRLRKYLAFALKLGITGVVLYVILSHISLGDMLRRGRQISLFTICAVFVLLAGHVVVSALRWRVVLDCLGAKVSWTTVLSGTLIERFINQALPSTVSGDAGRVMSIRRQGLPLPVSVLSVVFDRALALGGIVLAVAIGLPLALRLFSDHRLQDALLGIVGVSGLGVAALLIIPAAFLARMAQVKGFRRLARLVTTTQSLFTFRRFIVIGFGSSLLVQLFLVVAFQLIARDLGAPLSFPEAFAAVPAMTLVSLIPLTLAGWGAREGMSVLLLAFFGISAENALATSIIYGLMTLAVSCLGAILWLVMETLRPATPIETI
jgi:uncharacterized protein (TIRG00374 family)